MRRNDGRRGAAQDVLVIAAWDADPTAVVDACRARTEVEPVRFSLLVPARLPGLDWLGDPAASCPCASRQLEEVSRIAVEARLDLRPLPVGAPEMSTAVSDALAERVADEILLCSTARVRVSHPFDLVRRLRRITGLPVRRAGVNKQIVADRRRRWFGLRASHCGLAQPQRA